ncbi:invasion associated locus B family protein [Flexibacterium corallicola]|uniref:hypothetical protein n=1 Tax=Flexibacterium corallicola TaxID=3037259 RepID=UPI00286F8B6C|nr:hypothetical protein [Pseudovibrio sp. M1P-2-3]
MMRTFIPTIVLTLLSISPVSAFQAVKDWSVFGNDTLCWASTYPIDGKTINKIKGKKDGHLSVLYYPAQNTVSAISVGAGVLNSDQWTVSFDVDGRRFEALSFKQAAFVGSGAPERRLIAAMKAGKQMTVSWKDAYGNRAKEVYSLLGFTEASKEAAVKCRNL